MKSQLSDSSDIVATLNIAPPTKRQMHWKETGGVNELFSLPGRKLFAKHVMRKQLDDLTPVVTAQPGAARSGGAMGTVRSAAPMAAVSFRPSGPLVTTARPTLSPPAPSVTKTIVTQNPAGVFKPITTQVSVALKPSPALPVRVPAAAAAGQRLTVVSQQPALGAVTLTQPLTSHIQVSVSTTNIDYCHPYTPLL